MESEGVIVDFVNGTIGDFDFKVNHLVKQVEFPIIAGEVFGMRAVLAIMVVRMLLKAGMASTVGVFVVDRRIIHEWQHGNHSLL